ncbi:DNA-binding protein [Phascolomyces articulosus]|uniref:DNA-binding protein n=1 Tax=Phascolomyces articulosus TaxID=60185 RepID=A0AAD5KEX1_9FUNG|nr:DNA-binding protein [Phascolomyces articulosus]
MVTRQDLVHLLLDFINVWIHQILYERDLYPAAIFSLKKKYNVPVHIATHEGVINYIAQFVNSLQPLLLKGNCKSITVKIMVPSNNRLLESFVFEIESALGKQEVSNIPLDLLLQSESTCILADVQQQLRACLLRIASTRALMSKNPPDCTFKLTVETFSGPPSSSTTAIRNITDTYTSTTSPREDWIPTQDNQQQQQHQRWNQLIPLKTIPMDLFKINIFVMEGVKKGKQVSR